MFFCNLAFGLGVFEYFRISIHFVDIFSPSVSSQNSELMNLHLILCQMAELYVFKIQSSLYLHS